MTLLYIIVGVGAIQMCSTTFSWREVTLSELGVGAYFSGPGAGEVAPGRCWAGNKGSQKSTNIYSNLHIDRSIDLSIFLLINLSLSVNQLNAINRSKNQ